VDDAPFTGDLDLSSAASREDLAALLRTIHLRADRPSLRTLESRTRHDAVPLSKTAVSEMLNGLRFPRKNVMVGFLRACGVHDDDMTPWLRTWERIAAREHVSADRNTRYTSAGITTEITGSQMKRLHDQINQLNADNDRLRRQLAAIDRRPAEHGKDPVDTASGRPAHNPIARGRELGLLLRALRAENGLTIGQVAEHLMCSVNKVRGIEASFRAGTLRDVRDLCDLYGVSSELERDRIMRLAQEAKERGWWESYELSYATLVGLEAEAVNIFSFQSSVVHGLLQTADYARAGHERAMPRHSSHRIEMQIEAKLTRQRILTQDHPPTFTAVLDEAALRRMVGGRQAMAAQLAKILELSARPNIVVQVIPFELGAHPAMESNFTLLEMPSPAPGVVFVEGLIGSFYLQRPEELRRYREVSGRLRSIALSPEESAALIADIGGFVKG
jgi:transcriptional regulator with XRE-family HTH domain